MGLAASRLPVAEDRGGESVHGHLDQALHPGVLQHVLLGGLWLEHHVEGERLQFAVLPLLLVDLKGAERARSEKK